MNNKLKLEQRSYLCEVKACEVREDENRKEYIITGRPVVYDSRTDLGVIFEIIDKGALEKTNLKDVRFLVNHDLSKIPLARSRRNNKNSTMQLTVDDGGLSIRVRLDVENNSEARALYSAVERGDITGMSFMFTIEGEKWEELSSDKPTRHITDIGTIVEVSAVTFPAYESTEISTRSNNMPDGIEEALERARQSAQTVDTAKKLELLKLKAKILYGG